MQDHRKTKAQLIAELESARARVAELEAQDFDTHSVLEAIIQQSPIPMAIATPAGELWSFNEACAEHLGFEDNPDIKPGTGLAELKRTWQHFDSNGDPVPPEELPLALAFRGEATHDRVFRVVRKDGTERWQSASAVPVYATNGELLAAVLAFPDITERRRAEQALQESERQLKSLVESVRVIPWRFDLRENRFTFIGKQVEEILGYPVETWTDFDSWSDRIEISDRQAAVDYCLERRKKGEDHDFEYRTETSTGEIVWIRDIVTVKTDEAGAPLELIGFMVDITASKAAEEKLTRSRKALSEAQQIARLGSWELDIATGRPVWSDQMFALFGMTPDAVPDIEAVRNLIVPEDVAVYDDAFKKLADGIVYDSIEYRIKRADGQVQHLLARARGIFDPPGSLTRLVGTLQDVTDQKAQEANLNEAQRIAHTGHWIWDPRNGDLYWSDELLRIFGEKLTFEPSYDTFIASFCPDDKETVAKAITNALADIEPYEVDARIITRAGETRDIHLKGEVTFDDDGQPVLMRGTVQDITERKQAEEALRRIGTLESGQRGVLELISGDQASQTDILEAITRLAEEHVTDVRASILLFDGHAIRPGAAPSMPEDYNALLDGLLIGPAVGSCGTAMYRKERVIVEDVSTDPLWADYRELGENYGFRACWSQPILDSNDAVLGTFAIYREQPGGPNEAEIRLVEAMTNLARITIQRKRRETELRKLSAAIEQSPALVMITDRSGTIEYVNRKFCDVTGYAIDEIVGKSPRILKGEDRPRSYYRDLWKTVLSGREWRGEFLNKKRDGELYWEVGTISSIRDENGEISHLLSVSEETTDRKALEAENQELERRVRRSQKLDTIGTLAGGIAHDFNNILTPIMGYAEIAEDRTDASDPLHSDLGRILSAAQRAKELIDRILLFSRQTEKERKPVRIQSIAHEAIQLLRSSIPATIAIDEQIDSSCGWVFADEAQIHEVIVNICTNAYHAMEGGTGTLTIGVEPVELDADAARMHPNLEEAEYVRISIRDTGSGMDSETQERIFEPFFTTKTIGKGTGMGLSVVHGIVQSHHGEVVVHSTPGEGTVFEVYLPVTAEEARPLPEDSKEMKQGQGSILVVDDDPAIADVVTAMVEQLGYEVTTYTSSHTALEELTRYPERYDLVVSDLTMPNLTGKDLFGRLAQLDPPIPILIMTGYGDELEEDGGDAPKVVAKPFALKELAGAIRELLDDSVAARGSS